MSAILGANQLLINVNGIFLTRKPQNNHHPKPRILKLQISKIEFRTIQISNVELLIER